MGSITNTSFQVKETKATQQPGSDVPQGDLGVTMDIWKQDRITILQNLAGGSFTNNSSYPIPSGVVEATNGFDTNWVDQEKTLGTYVKGKFIDAEGKPMSGIGEISVGDYKLAEKSITGQMILSGQPLPGVPLGQSINRDAVYFRFSPSKQAIAVTNEDFGGSADLGTIQYGEVSGKVTNYYGSPVSGVTVAGPGLSDVTDSSGRYRMLSPGGTELNLTTLGDYNFTITPSTGEKLEQDFTFPLLKVVVKDGNYQPIENAPVDINGNRYYTGSNGEVELPKANIGLYDIVVMSDFAIEDYVVDQQAVEFAVEVSPGNRFGSYGNVNVGSLEVDIVDGDNGEPVSDVECVLVGDERISLSNRDGTVKLLSDDVGGSAIIAVAKNDNRYETEVISVDVPESGVGYEEVILSRGSKNPTY